MPVASSESTVPPHTTFALSNLIFAAQTERASGPRSVQIFNKLAAFYNLSGIFLASNDHSLSLESNEIIKKLAEV